MLLFAVPAALLLSLVCAIVYVRGHRRQRALQLEETVRTLLEQHDGVCVESARVVAVACCGDGKASTTDRITLQISYTRNDPGLPPTMVLKDVLLPWWLRLGASQALMDLAAALARAVRPLGGLDRLVYWGINAYQRLAPHAPDSMYLNETLFYRLVRPELGPDFGAPQAYGTVIDPARRRYCVLMTDLARAAARFPTALDDTPPRHVAQLLSSLAELHARFWQSPRFQPGGDLAWVPTPLRGGMYPVFHTLGFGLIRDHVARNAFEQQLLAPLGLPVEALWEGLCTAEVVLSQEPTTLCHGDTHVQNTYVLPSTDAVGLLDWQLTLRASWARDVAYILGTALTPAARRAHQDALLAGYLQRLAALGVTTAPDFATARRLLAMSMAWGLVIGWLICPADNYGVHILSANVERLVAACVDLDTFALLRQARQ
eukprot:m.230088 g.230088  ORF g.230088 m.230088 type:complete len:431 (+) comp22406_c4_seq1:56-1348(+)